MADQSLPPRVLMAFDYGLRRIGVAVGQSITQTANEVATINARAGLPHWPSLDGLLQEWQPDQFIIGLPLNMDDTETSLCPDVRRFARRITHRYQRPVCFADERLTTHDARRELHAAGRHRKSDHAVAARLILETWFTHQRGV